MQHPNTLTDLTEEQRDEALQHFQVIRPYLEDGISLTHIARSQGLQLLTLRRWVQRYRAHGLAGLVRLQRKDKGKKRAVTAEIQQLIEGLALQRPQRTVANFNGRSRALHKSMAGRIQVTVQLSVLSNTLILRS